MDENSKKRSRKSKLVPRKYLDSDDENIAQMQEEIEETIASINPRSILSKLGSSKTPPNSIAFSVKVEVEEFNEDVPEIQQVEYLPEEVNNIQRQSIDQTEDKEINNLEKTQNKQVSKKNKIPPEHYKIDENLLKAEIDSISAKTPNKADKLIKIYTRNYYGRFQKYTADSLFNTKLQDRLKKWRTWYDALPDLRDSPSMYICYICKMGWWHFSEFREHIKQHNDIKYRLESTKHDFKLTVYHGCVGEYRRIPIASDCWKCGKDISAHLSFTFTCKGCEQLFTSCSLLSIHEGVCDLYKSLFRNLGQNTSKSYKCLICPYKHWLQKELDRHMVYRHSVRSDIPISWMTKQCPRCRADYHDYNMHECLHRPTVAACSYCCKTFQTKETLELHLSNSKPDTPCRICGKVLKRGCKEMQHLLKHTDKYIMMYKCAMCMDPLFFLDAISVRQHKLIVHRKRKHRQEKVFVPKSLISKLKPKASKTKLTKEINYDPEFPNVSVSRNDTCDMIQNSIKDYFDEELGMRVTVIDKNTIKEILKTATQREELGSQSPVEPKIYLIKNKSITNERITNESNIKTELNEFKDNEAEDKLLENINPEIQIKQEINDEFETTNENEGEFENVHIKQESMDIEDYIIYNEETNYVEYNEIKIETENKQDEKPIYKIEPVEFQVKDEPSNEIDEHNRNDVDEMDGDNSQDVPSEWEDNSSEKHDRKHKLKKGNKWKIHQNQKRLYKSIRFVDNYKCTKCDTNSPSLYKYLQHFKKYKYKVPTCPKCFKQFECPLELTNHVYSHIKNNFVAIHLINYKEKEEYNELKTNVNFQCRTCNVNLSASKFFEHWESHLKIHESTADEENYMDGVDKNPQLKVMLDILQGIDSSEARANGAKQCVKCKKWFQRSSDCKRHYIEHLLSDAYNKRYIQGCLICQICGSGFEKRERYKSHLRGHASLPIYKCAICDKTFGDSSNFCKHKKVHAPVFICDICNKKFNARVCFIKHIQMHEVIQPIRCNTCDKLFYSQSSYNKHLKKNRSRFKCPGCDIYYCTLKEKWDHMWKVHKERKYIADCPLCNKPFRKYRDVIQHLKKEHKGTKYEYKTEGWRKRSYKNRFSGEVDKKSAQSRTAVPDKK